jgi:hypothetical protein
MNTVAAQLARPRTQALRLAAWLAGPAAIAGVHLALAGVHPVVRMWALVATLFLWMKGVVLAENIRAGRPLPSLLRLAAWTLLWPGMRPGQLRTRGHVTGRETYGERGALCIVAGFVLICLGLMIGGANWWIVYGMWFLLVGIPLILAGMSLILHFGVFNLVTCVWREAGFDVGPLFRNPFASRSLADFWGRRWNLAYVEMCQETILRALKTARRANAEARTTANQPRIHTDKHESVISVNPCTSVVPRPFAPSRFRGQQLAVFLFSGLLHECAISLPVNAGYGLPMLYFMLNGGAMLAGRKLREGSVAARLWAAFWVIAPLPLLFHPWFIVGIVLPMVGIQT